MSGSALKNWYDSPFTGLFRRWGPLPRRPHDPDVACWSGVLPGWGDAGGELAVGGAGWTAEQAEQAALGEAVERWQARRMPGDRTVLASFAAWPLDEPAVDPARWVLFHPEQYTLPGFPFAPLTRDTVCHWVACRVAGTGEARWVPEAMVYLLAPLPSAGDTGFAPMLSTGLSAGRMGTPVLLRGLQEVIERDALVGAWWGSYPLQEHDGRRVLAGLPVDVPPRLVRPNLRWRFYRVVTPLAAHVTIVTLAGEDHEGFCFSVGSACRETRPTSWLKAILEAVQGRHYVRYLRRTPDAASFADGWPSDFAGHALYYSLHPERLGQTVLLRATSAVPDAEQGRHEGLAELSERLSAARPVLFRLLTPPGLAAGVGWVVLRVLVPSLQPLHGHHAYSFLGGPLWAPRSVAEYREVLPHPFP